MPCWRRASQLCGAAPSTASPSRPPRRRPTRGAGELPVCRHLSSSCTACRRCQAAGRAFGVQLRMCSCLRQLRLVCLWQGRLWTARARRCAGRLCPQGHPSPCWEAGVRPDWPAATSLTAMCQQGWRLAHSCCQQVGYVLCADLHSCCAWRSQSRAADSNLGFSWSHVRQ